MAVPRRVAILKLKWKEGRSKLAAREVDIFTAYLTILDLIDHEMPGLKTLGELRTLLVLWRKTHAWGKLSEQIGTTELVRRTNLDRVTVRRSVHKIAASGFITVEAPQVRLESGSVMHERKEFTWPINSRVKEALVKASSATKKNVAGVGTTCTDSSVNLSPSGWIRTAPTQSEVH
jgi:hypothetical protein